MDKSDGYTQIPNNILDAMVAYGFTAMQLIVILYVIRKTYGYHKIEDDISITKMAKETRRDRSWLSRAVSDLEKLNVISVERRGGWRTSTMYVKNPDDWDRPVADSLQHTVAKAPRVATSLPVAKNTQTTVADSPHPTVAGLPQTTVADSPHTKESKENIKEKKKRGFAPSFSQDEDDDGEDPAEMLRRLHSGNL